MSLTDSNIYEYETGKYRATFTIPQSEISQSGTYSLFFRAADNVSNVGQICQSFLIDADCPTGSISISNSIVNNSLESAYNVKASKTINRSRVKSKLYKIKQFLISLSHVFPA